MSPSSDDKGKFSANISQDVIDEALKSVRKHTGEPPAEAAPAPSAPPGDAAPAAAEAASAQTPQDKEIEQLKAQLEFSQMKGRELMEKVKDSHERMLRATADLENFKKRAQKERDEV